MHKIIISLALLTLIAIPGFTQDNQLECETGGLFNEIFESGKRDKIVGASIVAETEKTLTVEVELEGFKDGEYSITGMVASQKDGTREINKITTEPQEVPKGGGTVELTFTFDSKGVRTTKSHIETKSIKLTVSKKRAWGSGLSGFGTIELTCECDKKWRIAGGKGTTVVVSVKLTPYKSAHNIKP